MIGDWAGDELYGDDVTSGPLEDLEAFKVRDAMGREHWEERPAKYQDREAEGTIDPDTGRG